MTLGNLHIKLNTLFGHKNVGNTRVFIFKHMAHNRTLDKSCYYTFMQIFSQAEKWQKLGLPYLFEFRLSF